MQPNLRNSVHDTCDEVDIVADFTHAQGDEPPAWFIRYDLKSDQPDVEHAYLEVGAVVIMAICGGDYYYRELVEAMRFRRSDAR